MGESGLPLYGLLVYGAHIALNYYRDRLPVPVFLKKKILRNSHQQ